MRMREKGGFFFLFFCLNETALQRLHETNAAASVRASPEGALYLKKQLRCSIQFSPRTPYLS